MVCLKYLCVFLILLGMPLHAQAKTVVFNLRQAVEHALEANPGVEAKLLVIEKARMDVGVAQSYFWPTVSVNASRSKLRNSGGIGTTEDFSNLTGSRGLRVSLSLFSGFAHLNNLQKSLLTVDMEKARHRQAKLELIGNVQLQFLSLLKSREDMKTVQESKKRITTQLKAAEAFVEVGMAPYLNVLQNEVELSKVNQQEIRVGNLIRNTQVILNRFLGLPPDAQVEYKGDLKEFNSIIGYSEKEAIEASLHSRPDLVMAQKSIDIAVKQSHMSAAGYLPQVNASYDNTHYTKHYTEEGHGARDYTRRYWSIGLNFSWDLFNGGGTTFTYLGDRRVTDSLRKEYEDTMSSARAQVIQSLLDIQAAKELIVASRKAVEAAKESYGMADKRYTTNTGTITELLDAQVRLTQAEEDYSLALTEFHSARSRFFYNIGKENIGLD